mgnify:CR=1 FL=1
MKKENQLATQHDIDKALRAVFAMMGASIVIIVTVIVEVVA